MQAVPISNKTKRLHLPIRWNVEAAKTLIRFKIFIDLNIYHFYFKKDFVRDMRLI